MPEHDDIIESVDEFWSEESCSGFDIVLPCELIIWFEADSPLGFPGTKVAGHKNQGIAKIDGSTNRIGQPSFADDLEQIVKNIRMGFLDFIKQQDREGCTPNGAGKLSIGLLKVSDQLLGCSRRIDLVHVESDQMLVAIEEDLRNRFGCFRFADSRGS